MAKDQQGLPLTGAPASAAALDRATAAAREATADAK